MTTPAGIQKKIRQLDNDVQAIYELLTGIQATQTRQGNRLEEIAATQAEHSAVLTEHGTMLASHSTMLAENGRKLDTVLEILRTR